MSLLKKQSSYLKNMKNFAWNLNRFNKKFKLKKKEVTNYKLRMKPMKKKYKKVIIR